MGIELFIDPFQEFNYGHENSISRSMEGGAEFMDEGIRCH
jgi:hypothetical protein